MSLWERGGVVVHYIGAELGPPLLRLDPSEPDRPIFQTAPSGMPETPDQPTQTTVVVDLSAVAWSVSALTAEVQALRRDLDARSLEGRWRRCAAWVRACWDRLVTAITGS